MDIENPPGHSEAYFGDYRDFWWNADFLELMARRQGWHAARTVLDVGCGAGHWTRAIAPHLAPGTRITAVDRDAKWGHPEAAWARALSTTGIEVAVLCAGVEALPFADASFDLVTCQTLLIHVVDPQRCIAEMLRVLRPGGLLLCAEPDNLGAFAAKGSLSDAVSVDDMVADFEFALRYARGTTALGLGDASRGGLIPGLLAAAGLQQVHVYLSDKAMPSIPPYDTPEQRALHGDLHAIQENAVEESPAEVLRRFVAGGGDANDFNRHWQRGLAGRARYREALHNGTLFEAGGTLMYLVSGRRAAV